jgi:hypothetical protein
MICKHGGTKSVCVSHTFCVGTAYQVARDLEREVPDEEDRDRRRKLLSCHVKILHDTRDVNNQANQAELAIFSRSLAYIG